ncbi:MAG: MFS transporter [Myxococcales bacterium]|nr:MFS transporter [Myxococcales bacterium]
MHDDSGREGLPLDRTATLLYSLIACSLGMAGGFFLSEVPYLMRTFGIPLESIGWYSTASVFPYVIQPLFNPMTDLGMKRKSWFVWLSVACVMSIAMALYYLEHGPRSLFYIWVFTGQVMYGLATSCYGGLAATTLDRMGRLRASNLLNMGAQAGGAVGSTALLAMTQRSSLFWLSIVCGASIAIPSLAALLIKEPNRPSRRAMDIARSFAAEARQTMSGSDGWLGLAMCVCPAGTIALNFFLPALAIDYHAPEWMTVSLNGFFGWMLTLSGIYLGGQACLRHDSRVIYVISAFAMTIVGLFWAIMPITPTSYAVGSIVYSVVQGASLASCSAMVFDLISRSATSSSTQYSVFYAVSSIAQMYVLSIDTHAYSRSGLRALYASDALLNLIGAVLLLLLLRRWGQHKSSL